MLCVGFFHQLLQDSVPVLLRAVGTEVSSRWQCLQAINVHTPDTEGKEPRDAIFGIDASQVLKFELPPDRGIEALIEVAQVVPEGIERGGIERIGEHDEPKRELLNETAFNTLFLPDLLLVIPLGQLDL